jgi:7-carboxy-7-deazaguanine synthase
MVKLLDLGFLVSLETSGALDVSAVDPRVVKVMDLKTPSSGEIQRNRYANIEHLTVQDQVKFVIADDVDYQWSKQQMIDHQLLDRCQVLFSPVMGVMPAVELAEKILADQLAVRFQIQLHKYLWNDARGK